MFGHTNHEAVFPGGDVKVSKQIAWNLGFDPIPASEPVDTVKRSELPPLISKKAEETLNDLLWKRGYREVEGCDHLIPPKRLVYPE